MVGSTIWPILYGLYRPEADARGATVAMLGGSILGLAAYFTLGWYTASLVGTAASFALLTGITRLAPARFDWKRLNPSSEKVWEAV